MALAEDVGAGDLTSRWFVPEGLRGRAAVMARRPLTVSGTDAAVEVFRRLDAGAVVEVLIGDGGRAEAGTACMRVAGRLRPMLAAERTALNFLQRLSGVATLTRRFVEAVKGTKARILDTRKTTPGWRALEKAAVRHGGGCNHRQGLYDAILVKDNHWAAHPPDAAWLADRIAAIRREHPGIEIGFEADTLDQAARFAGLGVDVILLDNMSPEALRAAVGVVAGRAQTEASGGVTLETVRAIAETGVDRISVGALTHSAPAADLALDFEPAG